jgi:hypothetical protein
MSRAVIEAVEQTDAMASTYLIDNNCLHFLFKYKPQCSPPIPAQWVSSKLEFPFNEKESEEM